MRHTTLSIAAGAIILTLSAACGSELPVPPTPVQTPAPAPQRYHLSGVVTDDQDQPVADATIAFDYEDAGGFKWVTLSTDSAGRYEFQFDGRLYTGYAIRGVPGVVGVIRAWQDRRQFDSDTQLVIASSSSVARRLRIPRARWLTPGQSMTVVVEADSALCADLDSDFRFDTRCETVRITPETAGRLAIEARAETGTLVPGVEFHQEGAAAGTGAASHSVVAGRTYYIRLMVPSSAVPLRIQVSAAMR